MSPFCYVFFVLIHQNHSFDKIGVRSDITGLGNFCVKCERKSLRKWLTYQNKGSWFHVKMINFSSRFKICVDWFEFQNRIFVIPLYEIALLISLWAFDCQENIKCDAVKIMCIISYIYIWYVHQYMLGMLGIYSEYCHIVNYHDGGTNGFLSLSTIHI